MRRELEGPALPAELGYLWDWFLSLHIARRYNEAGPQPIGYAEIDAWARLTRTPIAPWEVEALRSLDMTWLAKGAHAN